jgi:hypothetical protein
VFDTGIDDGLCFIVMELFEGRNLADLLQERRHLDPPESAAIVQAVLDALGHAHAAGVVHRDVKPSNILVGPSGAVKVTDFGIAKAAFAGDITTTGKLLGTARYLAPEQVADQPVDHRADLYAVGVVLYEVLTGRPPFQAETDLATATMRLTKDPKPPGALRAGIPRSMEQVVMQGLARDPDQRFQTADEMRAALDRIAAGHTAPSAPAPAREPQAVDLSARSFFRSWLLVPLAIVAAAGLIVVGGLILGLLEPGGQLGIQLADPARNGGGALKIASASAFDPEGDEEENSDSVDMAIDTDPETAWTTERYNSPELGGLKSGVGLLLDLGRSREIGAVRIITSLPDWRFELRGSSDGSSFSGLKSANGGETSFVANEDFTIELEPATVRYVLVWITNLPPADGGYRADIARVQVLAPD